MHCRVCGYRLSRDAVICGECGSVVGALDPEIFPEAFSQSFPVSYASGSFSRGVEDTRLLQPGADESNISTPQQEKRSETGNAAATPAGSASGAAEPIVASPAQTTAVRTAPARTPVISATAAVPDPAVSSAPTPAKQAVVDPLAFVHPAQQPVSVPRGEAPPRSTPRHVLTSLTGERLVITGHSVLGRRPQSDDPEMHLLTLVDRTRSVSKTHLELGVNDGILWVCDLSSANGTIIVMPDGTRVDTAPGQYYSVPPGAHLLLGLAELVVD